MATSTVPSSTKLRRVIFTIPSESTLPITYTVPGITQDMKVVGAFTSNAYVFQGLTATTSNGTVVLDGTRWGEYDDTVTIEMLFSKTVDITATPVVEPDPELEE